MPAAGAPNDRRALYTDPHTRRVRNTELLSSLSLFDNRNSGDITHYGGVAWYEHKKPFVLHRCWGQTTGWFSLTFYERCPCGAIRRDGRKWYGKNSRKRGR